MKRIFEDDMGELKEIDKRLKEYKHDYMMYLRLSVIKMVLNGYSRGDAAKKFNVHRKTAENWVKSYYEYGLDGLEPNYSNCGLKCKLSDDQLMELKEIVLNSDVDYDISSVKNIIKEKYGVEYTYKQTWFILRKKLGFKLQGNKLIT